MENLKVTVAGDQKFLTIREGEALPQKEPLVVSIAGDIDTVKNFIAGRKAFFMQSDNLQAVDKDKAIILFDKENKSITLHLDPTDYYGPIIAGKMEISPELQPWHINQSKTFKRDELLKLIRFGRRYFSDGITYDLVLKSFQNLELSGQTQLKNESDLRGNKNQVFAKKIDSGSLPTQFFLHMPIFKGQPVCKFSVEVCLDSSENSVVFWFESVELAELIETKIEQLFTEQRSVFSEYVIINK